MKKYQVLLICFFTPCTIAMGQIPISLKAAIDTALKNNLQVKNERLNAEYQKKLKATAINLPQTSVIGEYGQINSAYNDTKFGISQSVSLPTVYVKQKSLQNETYKSSVLMIAVKESELIKQLSEAFYFLVSLQQKQKILLQNDSVYAIFLEKANLRFSKGETNVLEKTIAETQRGQISIQLNQLKSDLEVLQLEFQLLLNTTTFFLPTIENPKMVLEVMQDTLSIRSHPQLKILEQQQKISLANTQLERARLLPDLTIGYNNQSIRGAGADNVLYPKSTRFSSAHIGLSIPLFFGSQRAKVNSSKAMQLISANNYQHGLQSFKAKYNKAFRQYRAQLQTVKYFEETALKNAETIKTSASQQFANGDINYLEWTMLLNNATIIQNNYIEAIKDLNQSIIQLNFLTSK